MREDMHGSAQRRACRYAGMRVRVRVRVSMRVRVRVSVPVHDLSTDSIGLCLDLGRGQLPLFITATLLPLLPALFALLLPLHCREVVCVHARW